MHLLTRLNEHANVVYLVDATVQILRHEQYTIILLHKYLMKLPIETMLSLDNDTNLGQWPLVEHAAHIT